MAMIMSVYKSDSPLDFKKSLLSVFNQTVPCDVFLFQDGDISRELELVIEEFFDKIKILKNNHNVGLATALNKLIDSLDLSFYDFVARMDSDDICAPTRIEKQIEFMNDNPDVDVSGCYCREFGASYALDIKRLPTSHEDLLDFSITRCPFIHPTVIFRTEIFSAGFRYPVNTKFTEDMALWFELLLAGYRFGNLDLALLDYRLNENTIERRQGLLKGISEFKLRLKYMFLLKRLTLRNFLLISLRVLFHLLPSFLLKVLYSKYRS